METVLILCLPTILSYFQSTTEDSMGKINRHINSSKVADPSLVAFADANVNQESTGSTQYQNNTDPPESPIQNPSTVPKAGTAFLPLIRKSLQNQGISADASSIIEESWRKSTAKQYQPYIRKWELFCSTRKIDPIQPTVNEGINFLATLYNSGIGYSALNTARSALSNIIVCQEGFSFGNHPLVCRFIKGVFNLRPSLPRYNEIWDIHGVFTLLKTWHPASEINLKALTMKVTMLIALLSEQRCQTLKALDIKDMVVHNQKYVFKIKKLLKTSRPGKHLSDLELCAYTPDETLCIFSYLNAYIERTEKLRGDNSQLLISYQKPFAPVSTDTIARWLKNVLREAGIDTTRFAAHSTRAASSSAAKANDIPIDVILSTAGWSNSETFARFYHKPIQVAKDNFGQLLLSTATK